MMHTTTTTDSSGAHLAAQVREALQQASYVPADAIDVEVRDHAVQLSGTVTWEHERVAAERAVEHLDGVHVLRNAIRLKPRGSAAEIADRVRAALRGSTGPIPTIDVELDGDSVILAGAVPSYTDRQNAERAARSMPRVRTVSNRLRIVRT